MPMKPSDCINCHLAAEERYAFPYLPERYREWMRSEHARLRKMGFPAQAVIDHSAEEMEIFRRFCPEDVVEQIEADHDSFDDILSAFAAKSLRVPGELRIG